MFHFTCTRCDFALDIDYIPREYILPDGTALAMPQRHVWCVTCGTIRPAESLCRNDPSTGESSYTPDFVDSTSGIDHAKRERLRRNLQARHERLIQEARVFDAWRAIRRGPPACLRCRATDFVLPDSDWSDLVHAPCGGVLKATATLFGGTSMPVRPHRYSPEGDLIALGSQTTQQIGQLREEELELW
jgi:hypothetical protein